MSDNYECMYDEYDGCKKEKEVLINAYKFYRHFFGLYIKYHEILADEYSQHEYFQNKLGSIK